MSSFLQGFWIFSGIVAGIIVKLVAAWYIQRNKDKKKLSNFCFEFALNEKKITKWQEDIKKLRDAINADDIGTFFGYFDFDKFVTVTSWDMFKSGMIYSYLDHNEIEKLQFVASTFSAGRFLNDQVTELKANYDKTRAVSMVNFWENKLKQEKESLTTIRERLEKKYNLSK